MVIDIEQLVSDIKLCLSRAGVPYVFTGGVVAIFYGQPRTTEDVDLVIQVSEGIDAKKIKDALSEKFDLDEELLAEAMQNLDLAQAYHREQFIKIDIHFGQLVPGEFERICYVEMFPGITVPILSREDAVLSKLLWIQLGSHRSKRDAAGILRRSASINREFLETMATELGVLEILREVDVLAQGESTERP